MVWISFRFFVDRCHLHIDFLDVIPPIAAIIRMKVVPLLIWTGLLA
jgi:hypothetical protein